MTPAPAPAHRARHHSAKHHRARRVARSVAVVAASLLLAVGALTVPPAGAAPATAPSTPTTAPAALAAPAAPAAAREDNPYVGARVYVNPDWSAKAAAEPGGSAIANQPTGVWNRYVDELSYAQAMRNRLVQAGFESGIGMLIDTSRNGWGGAARPTGPGATTSVDTYVDGGRIDRRIHLGNWCNQAGAGIGERPQVAPEPGIDAYVWIKPPGESDGAGREIPNDEGKGFDRMCDPGYAGNPRNNNNMSGALPDAPLSGHWFSAQFRELLANAHPALQ